MNMNEYQEQAAKTAIYDPDHAGIYPVLGLANEAGEVAGKLKKYMRDATDHETLRDQMKKELGDVLWYVAVTGRDFDLTLDEIAEANIAKLADRQQRGVLGGSGDNR